MIEAPVLGFLAQEACLQKQSVIRGRTGSSQKALGMKPQQGPLYFKGEQLDPWRYLFTVQTVGIYRGN